MKINTRSKNTHTLPNFIIIGASRSGTTSLYHYLRQHPQIYMSPIKETNFFAFDNKLNYKPELQNHFKIRTFDDYVDLFKQVSSEKIIGEASTRYLRTPFSARCIHNLLADIKLIAILRNPVDRFYSDYLARIRRKREYRNFSDFVESEISNFSYESYVYSILFPGLYYSNLKRYTELFDSNNLKIFIFEDFISDKKNFFARLLKYLDVDTNFAPDFDINYNPSGLPRNKYLEMLIGGNKYTKKLKSMIPYKMLTPINRITMNLQKNNLYKPEMPPSLREKLISFYKPEIIKLQDLIQRDLSSWLT